MKNVFKQLIFAHFGGTHWVVDKFEIAISQNQIPIW